MNIFAQSMHLKLIKVEQKSRSENWLRNRNVPSWHCGVHFAPYNKIVRDDIA